MRATIGPRFVSLVVRPARFRPFFLPAGNHRPSNCLLGGTAGPVLPGFPPRGQPSALESPPWWHGRPGFARFSSPRATIGPRFVSLVARPARFRPFFFLAGNHRPSICLLGGTAGPVLPVFHPHGQPSALESPPWWSGRPGGSAKYTKKSLFLLTRLRDWYIISINSIYLQSTQTGGFFSWMYFKKH